MTVPWQTKIDHSSYAIGMAMAFCECVAAGCKRCALSDTLRPEERQDLEPDIAAVARMNGVKLWYDACEDLPQKDRQCWWVFYRSDEALKEYRALREAGYNPVLDLKPFYGVLSYHTAD